MLPDLDGDYAMCEMFVRMDAIDREILAVLQEQGRVSVTELAKRVGTSLSSAQRRLQALERADVIDAYRAHLNPAAIGLGFQTLVFVTMRDGVTDVLSAFEHALREVPEVVEAQRLFGDPDYLVRVVAHDLDAFQQLYDQRLAALPGVQRLTTTLIMKTVVPARGLPIGRPMTPIAGN